MHWLVAVLLCGAATMPAPIPKTESNDEEIIVLGPVRDMTERIDAPNLPDPIRILGPVRDMTALLFEPPKVREPLIFAVGWFASDGMPYESYPLPMPLAQAHGVSGTLAFSLHGLHIETEAQKRLNGRGRSGALDIRLSLFRLGPVAVDLAGYGATAMSGDALYQGPTDITLGMHRKSNLFTGGFAFRLGAARRPAFMLSALTGTSRAVQTPELWFNDELIEQSKTLSQNVRSRIIVVRASGTWGVSRRVTLAGSVRYTNWHEHESLLLPRTAIDAHVGARIAIRRWYGINLAVRWSSDHRALNAYRSSLLLGLMIRH